MNLILFGAPGAGKGTQAKKMEKELNIPQISTGDLFRHAISNKTDLGIEANKYISKGELVPDSITIGMVEERLALKDCDNGFILDGFPRTIPQAEALENMLKSMDKKIDKVIGIDVPDGEIVDRITGRRISKKTGNIYHIKFNPPVNENEEDLYQREDDTEEKVRTRLKEYHSQTYPLMDFYKNKNLYIEVDGTKEMDEITNNIIKLVREI